MKFLWLVFTLVISACASNPQKDLNSMRPPLSVLPGPVKLRQQLTIKSPKLNQNFEAVISVKKDSLKVVALTAMGSILFSMNYDGKRVQSSNPHMARLARLVLSDILMASLKTEDLKAYLPQGLVVLDKVQERTVLSQKTELVKISYVKRSDWPREFVLVRVAQGYELKVRTIEEL